MTFWHSRTIDIFSLLPAFHAPRPRTCVSARALAINDDLFMSLHIRYSSFSGRQNERHVTPSRLMGAIAVSQSGVGVGGGGGEISPHV